MSDRACNCEDLLAAVKGVLDAATEEGHQLSDKEICDSIDWQGLRDIVEKYDPAPKRESEEAGIGW